MFYGAVQGAELFDPVVDNLIGVVKGAGDELDRLTATLSSDGWASWCPSIRPRSGR